MATVTTQQPRTSNDAIPTAPTTAERWFPVAVWLRQYNWSQFLVADLIAAVSVSALLIPESMGYADVAGVPVQMGLYAAPLALIGYAMFGGSKILVCATAGAVSAMSAGIVSTLSGGDQDAAVTLTIALALATGAVFLAAGLARLGWITNFMSKAIMAGFITGMAIQIIVGQLGKLLGVKVTGSDTFEKLWSAVSQVGNWNQSAVVVGIGSLILIFALERFIPKLPAALTAVVLASIYVAIVSPDVELVPEIPSGLPSLGVPSGISLSTWGDLLIGAAAVALISFSDGFGASSVISAKTHDELDTDQEFRAYGVANIGAGLLGGFATAGSLTKSSAAMRSGAKSQMANILLAFIVLLVLTFLGPAFQWLPETVLAAIVISVMLESANPKKLERLWRVNRIDFALASITFFIVLAVDLLPALIAGVTVSILYMVYRVSFPGREVLGREPGTGDYVAKRWIYGRRSGEMHPEAESVPGVIVYRFLAPLIFSNADAFADSGKYLLIDAATRGPLPHALVIDFQAVFSVDDTGASALKSLFDYAQRYGVDVYLARVHSETRQLLLLSGVLEEIGEQHVFDTVRNAVGAAQVSATP